MKNQLKALTVFALLGLLAGAIMASWLNVAHRVPDHQQKSKAVLLDQGIINILFIGIDARPGESNSRSDTLILASIDTGKKKAALLSIPRDTRMQEGHHFLKINAYQAEGGPEMVRLKIEQLLKVPIHYYALTNFAGFKDIVDILGGVTINVDQRMYKPSEDIDLRPGVQRLNGRQALAYCRFRGYTYGDIDRTARQQIFVKALMQEIIKPGTLTKLPRLAPELNKYITTDIPPEKLYLIARAAGEFQSADITTQTLPGSFYTDPVNGASYWAVDTAKLRGIVSKVLGGETIAVIEEGAPVVVAQNTEITQGNQESLKKNVPAPDTTTSVINEDSNVDILPIQSSTTSEVKSNPTESEKVDSQLITNTGANTKIENPTDLPGMPIEAVDQSNLSQAVEEFANQPNAVPLGPPDNAGIPACP